MPKGILTWSQVNVDSNSRQSLMNEKQQITILATITADNTKLPLMFIAEGQTEKVEKTQLGDVDYHWTTHSDNGWITEESFIKYLMHVREHFFDDDTIHLLLDIYKAHCTEKVKEMAQVLNIQLHFIPAGMTDEMQPLDRSIFGPFKAMSRKLFRERNNLGQPIKITKSEACSDIIRAWDSVKIDSIREAWSIYNKEEWDAEQERKRIKNRKTPKAMRRCSNPRRLK